MVRKKTEKTGTGLIMECTLCGEKEEIQQGKQMRKFYKCMNFSGTNILHERTGYYNVCKGCLREMASNSRGEIDRERFINTMKFLNRPFHQSIFEKCTSANRDTLGDYLRLTNMKHMVKETFEDSDGFDKGSNLSGDILKLDSELSEEDKKIEKDVVRLLGYDPFDGHDSFDKKFLNGELHPYLDEDTLGDQFKISVIIQIVNNNNQIRKIDLVINQLSSDSKSLINNAKDIDSLTGIKTKLTSSNDKLSKENSISVKNRGDKSAGKSTLTYMMRNYREYGFEDAEADYYDENKAKGMALVADISNRSIVQQLQLDENDKNDMLFIQRQLIQELQTKVDDLEEENRQLYVRMSNFNDASEEVN